MAYLGYISVLFIFTFAYKAISTLVSKKLRATLTAVDDIALLGVSKGDGRKIRGTAVICGGSIAGLLSARVCSDHFENVVIIEPEEWVATAEGLHDRHRERSVPGRAYQRRSRVPQYTSLHAYQAFTTFALRRLFPNFDREIGNAGARLVCGDLKLHWSGIPIVAPLHQYPAGAFPTVILQSRPGYETMLRRLVLTTCSNVKYVTGTAIGLVSQRKSANIIGSVRVRSCLGEESTLPAALIIDCTGPALGGLRWLQDLALTSKTRVMGEKISGPLEGLKVTYNPKMAYTTCEFDVPPRLFASLKTLGFPGDYETASFAYVNFPDPAQDKRNVVVTRREYNFLQVVCGGWDVNEPMANISDIKRFLSEIVSERPIPEWIQLMLDLFEEEKIPVTFEHARCPPSVYVQYHKAAWLPSNFIAIGDSVLQLNPIRGQGCTKACVEAVSLNALLARCMPWSSDIYDAGDSLPDDFGRNFFSLQAKRTGFLWDTYKSEDYAWKTTIPAKGDDTGPFGALALKRAFGSSIVRLMLQDCEVAGVWWHVVAWLAPPTDFFSPTILFKLAWMYLRSIIGL